MVSARLKPGQTRRETRNCFSMMPHQSTAKRRCARLIRIGCYPACNEAFSARAIWQNRHPPRQTLRGLETRQHQLADRAPRFEQSMRTAQIVGVDRAEILADRRAQRACIDETRHLG